MALINRISRMFTADFHAVLDRIEEPKVLLAQAIREMEDELAAGEARLHRASVEQDQVLARQERLAESLTGFDDELDICFDSGEESLARGLIKRKLETGRLLKNAGARRELLLARVTELQAILEENRASLDSMRQKAAVLMEDSLPVCSSGSTEGGFTAGDFAILDEEIEVAFLKEKLQRSGS